MIAVFSRQILLHGIKVRYFGVRFYITCHLFFHMPPYVLFLDWWYHGIWTEHAQVPLWDGVWVMHGYRIIYALCESWFFVMNIYVLNICPPYRCAHQLYSFLRFQASFGGYQTPQLQQRIYMHYVFAGLATIHNLHYTYKMIPITALTAIWVVAQNQFAPPSWVRVLGATMVWSCISELVLVIIGIR